MLQFISLPVIVLMLVCLINSQELCTSKETCGDCIRQLGCVWCSNPLNESHSEPSIIRCKNEEFRIDENWCKVTDIIEAKSSIEIEKDEDIRAWDKEKNISAIQIKPQKVKLTLKVGEEYKLDFQYAQAHDYPVDLYYIMDLSASMKMHKKKLSELGSSLTDAMQKITSNFRLGFGSFVDKTDMPFVSTVPSKFKSPCKDCVSPYSFKNHLSLTEDANRFAGEVEKAKVSGNLDFPEGGFDAIMQAIVCKKEIGWRENARHLLVFSTDASFHIAGDGKLAGVVEPNDGICHMENGEYTHALQYDYPSISHINYVAKQNNINLIFAVVEKQQHVYNILKTRIENSATGILDEHSSNVIKLVTDTYETLVDSIKMTDDSGENVEIKYSSTCPHFTEPSICGGIRVGVRNNYTVTIKALQCPPRGSSVQTIHIKPDSLSETLSIDLELICDCPCERPGSAGFEENASVCGNGNGNMECGVCHCHGGRFGKLCECSNNGTFVSSGDNSECTKPDDKEMCSGSGVCKCGQCECTKRPNPEQRIYGKFCQCDNYSCNLNAGKLCSGSEHGTCDCGHCRCHAGWKGDACECPDSSVGCIAPRDDKVCSGRGNCSCGECTCNYTDKYRYTGKYCEHCPSCPGQKCNEFKHCVECTVHKSGIYNETECRVKCSDRHINIVTNISKNYNVDADNGRKLCTVPLNSGCTIVFEYFYEADEQTVQINALEGKICPKEVNLYVAIGGLIGSIVLAGILLLIIWKITTTIHDRKEYEKFEKERKEAKFAENDNPLYKSVNTRFENPLFNRLSSMMHR